MLELVIPKSNILVPADTTERVIEALAIRQGLEAPTSATRDQVLGMLPIKLARGVPPFVNEDLIHKSKVKFLDQFPHGIPTYSHQSHPETEEANAYRGDPEYIDHIRTRMRDDFGLEIQASQVLTGSAGSQELVTSFLDFFAEGNPTTTTELTFDRTNRNIKRGMAPRDIKSLQPIPLNEDGSGLNVEEACRFFASPRPAKSLFLVRSGGNPDGSTTSIENVVKVAEAARPSEGRILLDEAYSRLYFSEEHHESFAPLQEFIDDGTVTMIFTCTKEGGHRGAAYAIGGEWIVSRILKRIADRRLAPNYCVQKEQLILETFPEDELGETLSFAAFLEQRIRPTLALSFATLKNILIPAGVRLSTENVTHGYNVAVYFPVNATKEEGEQFFKILASYGVNTPDLTSFTVNKSHAGFRIPFGGFNAEQCTVFSHLIVAAHQQVWPQ